MLPEIQSTALELPFALEMLGVVVGSMCGALAACARKLDIVGAAALAMVCGLGGGLIRDVIMQVVVPECFPSLFLSISTGPLCLCEKVSPCSSPL